MFLIYTIRWALARFLYITIILATKYTKMKLHALLALFIITASAFAQVNQNDAQGKRHGQWKGTYEKSKRTRYEGTFEHGKETGTFKYFNDDAKSTLAATRVFNADGSCLTTFFDEDGKKVTEGKEANKQREGEWKLYFKGKDAVMQLETYKAGKLHGVTKIFYENGNISEEITYKDGVQDGSYKKAMVSGKVIETSAYKNGKLNGPASFFNADGVIVAKGQFTDNIKTGKWQYYENGKLTKTVDENNNKIQLKRVERKSE
jgi:antitoxin component YwqK of YwqJK toxin-antitoxin module